MRKHGIGFSKAMEIVKSRRPQALPNFGFVSQLQQFEKSIKGICDCFFFLFIFRILLRSFLLIPRVDSVLENIKCVSCMEKVTENL